MTKEEFNNLQVKPVKNIEFKWFDGIGIIKKYSKKEIAFVEDNLFLFGRTKKVLPKMNNVDIKRLRSLGWEISDIYEGTPMFCKKL